MPRIFSPVVEQEISQIEQHVEVKRTESGAGDSEPRQERELVHEVVGEKIKEHIPSYQPASPPSGSSGSPTKQQSDALSYNDPQLAPQVQQLVNLVFEQGIGETLKTVQATKNPALIDAFHDFLVDEMYKVLVERGTVSPPPEG